MIKRDAWTAFAALSLLANAACSGETASDTKTATSAAETPTSPVISIDNARLVLAPVSGNPAALYFDLSYSGPPDLTIASIAIEGAGMSMIHQTAEKDGAMSMMEAAPIALVKGETVTFAPGGLHVMAMEPSADWKAGERVNITLTMSDGSTDVFAADIRAAGDAR
jgi:copper(I)-binding protein